MKTYYRITLDNKEHSELLTAIDLNLNTIKFIVVDKTTEPPTEKTFDNLEMARLSYCFVEPKLPSYVSNV